MMQMADNKHALSYAIAVAGLGAGAYLLLRKSSGTQAPTGLDTGEGGIDPEEQKAINALIALDNEINDLRETLAMLKSEVTELKVLLAEQGAIIASLHESIAVIQESLGRQNDSIIAMQESLLAIEAALDGLEEEKNSLLAELGNDYPQLESIAQYIVTIREELVNLNLELQAVKHERDLLALEVNNMIEHMAALEANRQEMISTIARFEALLAQAEAQVNQLRYQLELIPIQTNVKAVRGKYSRKNSMPFISAGSEQVKCKLNLYDASLMGDPTITLHGIKDGTKTRIARWSLRAMMGNGFRKKYTGTKLVSLPLGIYMLEAYRDQGISQIDSKWICEAMITTMVPRFMVTGS